MEREPQRNMERTTPLAVNFDGIPQELQQYRQWVVWKYAVIDGEIKKPPFTPRTGRHASVTNPATWGSFQEVKRAYEYGKFAGVGIVLTAARGIVAIDIDHCVIDGQIGEEAQRIIASLNSYTELSPSGTGIRIILEGKLPTGVRRQKNIEMYEELRYMTLTGHQIASTPTEIQLRHRELYGVYHRVFHLESKPKGKENTGDGGERQPSIIYHIARSDQTVIQKALTAKNGDNFRRYYYGDSSLWEGAGAKHASQSEADFTLVLMLLYWTNNDTTQVDRLFRQSGLMRDKWGRPIKGSETYGERIINDAIRKGKH